MGALLGRGKMTALPPVRGRLTPNAPLAPLVWFKAGGAAEWLFEPADADDLCAFLAALDPAVPVLPLGLGSLGRGGRSREARSERATPRCRRSRRTGPSRIGHASAAAWHRPSPISDASLAALPRATAAPDIAVMSCRHRHDAGSSPSVLQAPSICRRWRRWPSELPRPANDNGDIPWPPWAACGIAVGLLLLVGVAGILAS